MDQKNSSILVLLLAITIIGGVLASFGIPLLQEGDQRISLADVSQSSGTNDPSLGEGGANAGYVSVAVTRSTVQRVIASLQRQESYYRELTIELFWREGERDQSATSRVSAWTDQGSTMTTVLFDTGLIQRSVVQDGTRYLWYGNDQRYLEAPASQKEGDLSQQVLTYEDVLALPPESIVSADYQEKNGKYCVFVESVQEDVGYLERYWIEISSGLLVAAETRDREEDRLVHRMTETSYESPIQDSLSFILPNGQVLHQIQGSV